MIFVNGKVLGERRGNKKDKVKVEDEKDKYN
jgi:hypothetical protein